MSARITRSLTDSTDFIIIRHIRKIIETRGLHEKDTLAREKGRHREGRKSCKLPDAVTQYIIAIFYEKLS